MTQEHVIKPIDVVESHTDSRGRFTLGTDYADEDVTVLVVERETEGDR